MVDRGGSAGRLTFEVEIDTHLTEIDGHALRFRGHDAVELATSATFEQVAELLWTGALPEPGAGPGPRCRWRCLAGGSLGDRLRLAVDVAGDGRSFAGDLRPEAVAACGRSMIASVVESLPLGGRRPHASVGAGRRRGPPRHRGREAVDAPGDGAAPARSSWRCSTRRWC